MAKIDFPQIDGYEAEIYNFTFSSLEKKIGENIKSINFIVNVRQEEDGKRIYNLLEYRLSWKVDKSDKFDEWESP